MLKRKHKLIETRDIHPNRNLQMVCVGVEILEWNFDLEDLPTILCIELAEFLLDRRGTPKLDIRISRDERAYPLNVRAQFFFREISLLTEHAVDTEWVAAALKDPSITFQEFAAVAAIAFRGKRRNYSEQLARVRRLMNESGDG